MEKKQSDKKRILFILPALSVGGLERVQVTLANALSSRGHDVTVMIYGDNTELADELNDGVRFIKKPPKPHPVMSRIPYVRHKYYDDGMWETRATAKQLHKYYVGDEKYDVEIAFFRGLSIKIISGYEDESATHICWVHNDFRSAVGYMYHFDNMQKVYEAYSRFDKVICVSNEAEAGFRKVIGETGNTTTIYNLLPSAQIIEKSQLPPEVDVKKHNFNVVLVGRLLDSAKGQNRLIDAVSTLQQEGIDIGVTLVGDGVDEELIRSHIEEMNAASYIHMTGNQRNPYPYIANSDLLVCASYFEGYNLTVAEALILGTPVLSTKCTGPVEILDSGKYGMIVDNSTEGLTDGLRSLVNDRKLYEHYKNVAGSRKDFFDEESIISKIEDLF